MGKVEVVPYTNFDDFQQRFEHDWTVFLEQPWKTTIINTGTVAEFFEHGREIAKLIDQNLPLPEESTISFEDPEDLLELLRSDNLALFRAIKKQPDSIASLAERLGRGQEAVRSDINELAKLGIVTLSMENRAPINRING
jgi:predicted transcriptional regulator